MAQNQPLEDGNWTFLTNHCHVLICLDRDPHIRLRDVAQMVGITERAVQRIIHELEAAGVIDHHKDGRRNVYRIARDHSLRHPLESHHRVGELLDLINDPALRHADQEA
jgi:predicted ArsR family transcriptional regulator